MQFTIVVIFDYKRVLHFLVYTFNFTHISIDYFHKLKINISDKAVGLYIFNFTFKDKSKNLLRL